MHVSKVLMSMKDASIYMRMSTDMITPDGGKAKATLGATAHATLPPIFLLFLLTSSHFFPYPTHW